MVVVTEWDLRVDCEEGEKREREQERGWEMKKAAVCVCFREIIQQMFFLGRKAIICISIRAVSSRNHTSTCK